MTASAGAI